MKLFGMTFWRLGRKVAKWTAVIVVAVWIGFEWGYLQSCLDNMPTIKQEDFFAGKANWIIMRWYHFWK